MSIFGTPAAQSVAGLNQAEHKTAREADRKQESEQVRRRDLHDSVELVQALDAVRNLKSNEQEEAQDDRREHGANEPQTEPGQHRHIDVEG